jgi:hypothetical protein
VHVVEYSPDFLARCAIGGFNNQHVMLDDVEELMKEVGTVGMPMQFIDELLMID